jgi:hypothetical protein
MREDLLDGNPLFELLEVCLVQVHRCLHFRLTRVLAVVWHDAALPAGLANGQLRGALGTCGALHDLLAQLAIGRPLAQFGQSLGDILGFDLVAGAWGTGAGPPAENHNE